MAVRAARTEDIGFGLDPEWFFKGQGWEGVMVVHWDITSCLGFLLGVIQQPMGKRTKIVT